MMDVDGHTGRKAYARERQELALNRVKWPMRENYYISDGYLWGEGEVVREYDPLAYHEVVAEFARLREGDDRALVRFAGRWGLLEGECSLAPGWLSGASDDGADQDTSQGPYVTHPRDPLRDLWGHVRNVRLVLELYRYLQTGDHHGLARFLDSHRVPRTGSREEIREGDGPLITWESLALGGQAEERFSWGQPVSEAAVAVAEDIIATLLSDALVYLSHEVACRPFRVLPSWPSLLVVIYWHLANIVTGSRPLIRCQDPTCGALFLQTDRRQRYCPAPIWQAGKTGSPCGARARKRRQRQEDGA